MFLSQVAMCSAYVRIVNTCPPHIWNLDMLVDLLHYPGPCFQLVNCIQVAVEILGPQAVGGQVETNGAKEAEPSLSDLAAERVSPVRKKRVSKDGINIQIKRLKTFDEGFLRMDRDTHVMAWPSSGSDINLNEQTAEHSSKYDLLQERESYAAYFHELVLKVVNSLDPNNVYSDSMKERALTTLSMLCQVFSKYPKSLCYIHITKRFLFLDSNVFHRLWFVCNFV